MVVKSRFALGNLLSISDGELTPEALSPQPLATCK